MQSYRGSKIINQHHLTRKRQIFENAAFDAILQDKQNDFEDALKIIISRNKGDIYDNEPSIAVINSRGATLLAWALNYHKEAIANYILDYYLKNEATHECLWIVDSYLETALSRAVQCGYTKIVETLLNHSNQELIATHTAIPDGANCFTLIQTNYKTTVLQIAVRNKRDVILKLLLEKIALLENAVDIVNVTDDKGNTLLHDSCSEDHTGMTALLLQHKCFADSLNDNKETALHIACKNANAQIVQLLLRDGADPTIEDIHHKQPFDYVPEDKQAEFYEALGQTGALLAKNLKISACKALSSPTPFLAIATQFQSQQKPQAAITSRKEAHAYILDKTNLAHEKFATILSFTRLGIKQQKNSALRRELLNFYLPLVAVHTNLQTLLTEKFNLDPEFLTAIPVKLNIGQLALIELNSNEEGDQEIDFNPVLKPIPLYSNKIVESLKTKDETTESDNEAMEEIDLPRENLDEKIALLNKLNDNRDDILLLCQLLDALHGELEVYAETRTSLAKASYAFPILGLLATGGALGFGIYGINHYDPVNDQFLAFMLCLFIVIIFAVMTCMAALFSLMQLCEPCAFQLKTKDSGPLSELSIEHVEHLNQSLELLDKFVTVFHENHLGRQLDTALQTLSTELHNSETIIRELRSKLKEMQQLLKQIMKEEINTRRRPTHDLRLFSPRVMQIFTPKDEDDQTWLLEKNLFSLV